MMRPTLRAVLLFGAGIPLALGALIVDTAYWPTAPAYLGMAVVLAGLDAIFAVRQSSLTLEIDIPAILFIGRSEDLVIRVAAAGRGPVVPLQLAIDVGPELEAPEPQATVLVPGGRGEVAVALRPRRRGAAELHRIWLRWYGPLGLTSRTMRHELATEIPVVPNTRAVRDAALLFTTRDAFFGFKSQEQQGEGSEFNALRDYVPGLDHRAIDWKHSARHRMLVCKEFQAERNHQIVLAYDTGHLMSEPLAGIPKLDHAINAGLLIAYMSLRSGDRVGLYGFDSEVRQFSEPIGGLQRFPRFQQASADLDYRYEETNFTLGVADLLGRLKRRSLVVLQTDFVDTVTAELMVENLERLAGRHLILFVTMRDPALQTIKDARPRGPADVARAVIADEFLRDRMVVFERLRRLGVHCIDAPVEQVGVDLLNRYLMIKRRELI
ncbi:MAG: DUF58 domain-containing protein [Alphaproteobacteria bacterium]|nr:DUF58 domain-containing protein [Alphaproteobacteria bacterium]